MGHSGAPKLTLFNLNLKFCVIHTPRTNVQGLITNEWTVPLKQEQKYSKMLTIPQDSRTYRGLGGAGKDYRTLRVKKEGGYNDAPHYHISWSTKCNYKF